jgi:hypothetical protein
MTPWTRCIGSTVSVLALLGLTLWLRPGVLLAQDTPRVQITLPTTGATWTTTATPITVAGTARDNKGVVRVTWTNAQDGSGTAQGTTGWTAQVPLQLGANRLTVTAFDADGQQGQAVLTVTLTSVPPTITLAWDDTNTSGDGFQMQRCVGPLPCTFATVATIAFTDRSWTDTTVLSGQAYCYRLAVTLGARVGPYSNTTCTNLG